jgi:MinD-like ATPase involved in chromosome partitioning or flagellar assembly
MIYTFYSYKGGVGRSMALVNIAELFYQNGLNVLMVDFDLEAPGLERYFKEFIPLKTVYERKG